jgi:hypothetical protein
MREEIAPEPHYSIAAPKTHLSHSFPHKRKIAQTRARQMASV